MDKKYVFIDVDGTLLPFGNTKVSKNNLRAIALARLNGHKVYICTGRQRHGVNCIDPAAVDGMIYSSGALIYENDKCVCSVPMYMDDVDEIVNQALALDLGLMASGNNTFILGARREAMLNGAANDKMASKEMIKRMQKELDNGTDYHHEDIFKINLSVDKDKMNDKVIAFIDQLTQKFTVVNASVKFRDDYFYEITDKYMNKFEGIKWICRYHGCHIKNTIALGDSMNDYEMIRDCGCGIAMSNGDKEIKNVAKWITLDSKDDGLAYALNKELNLSMDI